MTFHYVYKTICLVSNKYYIGMHSTENLEDGYLGSGKILKRSVSKHGCKSHRKEILAFYSSREELQKAEQELVTEALIQDPLCMNLTLGGCGGLNLEHQRLLEDPEFRKQKSSSGRKGNLVQKEKFKTDPEYHRTTTLKRLEKLREHYDKNPLAVEARRQRMKKVSDSRLGTLASQTEESRQKRTETLQKTGYSSGEKNGQYGTCWINDGTHNQKINRNDLASWTPLGWKQGRLCQRPLKFSEATLTKALLESDSIAEALRKAGAPHTRGWYWQLASKLLKNGKAVLKS